MLSRSRSGIGAALLGLVLVLPLAGCTGLTPVYGDNGIGAERLAVSYAAPANRLEQVIYQDLALRLGRAEGAVPMVRIAVGSSTRALTSDVVTTPNRPRQVTVRARVTVTAPDGTTLYSGTRTQSADYTTDAQALANTRAAEAAATQAAHLLADTLRLQLIAVLAR